MCSVGGWGTRGGNREGHPGENQMSRGEPVLISARPEEPPMAQREQRVTPLELFFDLVFVYAVTQVTQLMSRDST
jgi:low temperature requirement protein LtrA